MKALSGAIVGWIQHYGIYFDVKESAGSVPKSTSDIPAFPNVIILLYRFKVYIYIYGYDDVWMYGTFS